MQRRHFGLASPLLASGTHRVTAIGSSRLLRGDLALARAASQPCAAGAFPRRIPTMAQRAAATVRFLSPYLGLVGFALRIGVAAFAKSPLLNRRACRFSPGRTINCDPSACSTRMGSSPVL